MPSNHIITKRKEENGINWFEMEYESISTMQKVGHWGNRKCNMTNNDEIQN